MKLKALLLGSAAALIAVSGANAADAVVAEPEPMDYVKVCDMYGAGFFYIPGTENCLKIGGYVRVEYDYTEIDPTAAGATNTVDQGSTVSTRLTFDVRSETDLGTLRGYARVDGSRSNDGGPLVTTDMNFSNIYIELGGFSTGFREIRSAIAAGYGTYDGDDQNFGNVFYVDYTWAANGLSVVAGVGSDDGQSDNGVAYIRGDYAADMWTVAASFTHITDSTNAAVSGDEQQYNIWAEVRPMDGFGIRAYYNDSSAGGNNAHWGVGAQFAVADNVSINANYWDTDGTGSGYSGQIAWTIVPDLTLAFNAQQLDNDNGLDQTDFKIRLNRSF
ncbi:MAG: porin [Rhizobiaceae bacterium]|nr:porin [Hyphomicrobiales bacterium]NRB31938.1 porin [Rhizobiaceae bacterium]